MSLLKGVIARSPDENTSTIRNTTTAFFRWRSPHLLLAVIFAVCSFVSLFEARGISSSHVVARAAAQDRQTPSACGGSDADCTHHPGIPLLTSLGAPHHPAVRAQRLLLGSPREGRTALHLSSSSPRNRSDTTTPYLVTVFGLDAEDETLRMSHFLHHYLDRLGVLPERCIFVLHSRHGEKAVSQGRSILASRGIQPKRVLLRQVFDTQRATALVRELLDEEGVTRADQWVLRVDSDELLTFKDAEEMVDAWHHRSPEGCNYFMLHLIDRVAPNGDLPQVEPIETGKSLFDQFPNQCSITKIILKGSYRKSNIHAGTIRTESGHHRCDETYSREEPYACRNDLSHLDVSHFKWVESVRPRLERRQKEYEALGYYWSAESARLLQYLDENNNRFKIDELCNHPARSTHRSGSDESGWEKLKRWLHGKR